MGKTARKSKHDAKMKLRRSAKAAKRAKYLALAGTSRKAKRQGKTTFVAGTFKHAHAMPYCGNPGCRQCFPLINLNTRKVSGALNPAAFDGQSRNRQPVEPTAGG